MIYKTFEEWFLNCLWKPFPLVAHYFKKEIRGTFEAGQASRQAEIDELKVKVKELEERNEGLEAAKRFYEHT